MNRITRQNCKILVCSFLAIGGLMAAPATAFAAPDSPRMPGAVTGVRAHGPVSGSVSVTLLGGFNFAIPGALLPLGVAVNTGIAVGLITDVTNNTNATLVLSANSGGTVTLEPGESSDLDVLGGGSLRITASL